jgi:chemotaxis signal transduction protein
LQALSFQYRNLNFCVRLSDISEVLEPVDLITLPRVPSVFEGVFQLRGRVITLMNFLKCFSLSQDSSPTQILVMAEPRNHFAVRVPGVVESISLTAGEIAEVAAEEGPLHSVLEGSLQEGEEIFHLLSAEKIFSCALGLVKEGGSA